MRTQATLQEEHLALLWRMRNQTLQLYVEQQGRMGPWADFWHLPAIASLAPWPDDAVRAGRHTSTGFRPNAAAVQVWAARAEAEAQEHGWLAGRTGGLWLSVQELHLGHSKAVMLLSPPLWATVRALKTLPPHQIGGLEALQDALCAPPTLGFMGMTELAHAIAAMPLLTPTLPPSTHTNCYLLGHQRLTLVDPGTPYPAQQREFVQMLQQRVNQGAHIEAIWLSHFHEDHIGAAMAVHERFGAPILAHRDTAEALRGRVMVHRLVADEEALLAEDVVYTALHTPGHAHGHLSFWSTVGGHLLSGDNVLGVGTPIVPPAPHGSMAQYMGSLERLIGRPLGLLLPGHGPPCARAGRRVQETLQARRAREALLLDVLRAYPSGATLDELVAKVYRGLGHALRGLAEMSTLSHLEKLVANQKLLHCSDSCAIRWRLAK